MLIQCLKGKYYIQANYLSHIFLPKALQYTQSRGYVFINNILRGKEELWAMHFF